MAFGLILTVAPLLAVAGDPRPAARRVRPGPALPWRAISGRLGLLIGTMLLAQVLINAAVISVRLLSPGDPAVVGALLAAAVLARVPLFVFTSLQTSLLPGLAGAIAAGDRARFRRLLARSCGVVAVLGVAGGLLATILGPWLTQVLFGARPCSGTPRSAGWPSGRCATCSRWCSARARWRSSRHRDQLLVLAGGVAVLAVITLGPGQVTMRVVTAYAAGCATVAVVLAGVLLGHRGAAQPGSVTGGPVGQLAEDVGVPGMPGVLPDHVHVDPAQ